MSAKDWSDGVAMSELLARVNRVASKLGPLVRSPDSRVRMTLKERSFRHYQTLGCIDSGQRDGRRVVYGIRHFTQALLIRRLLLEKVSAERVAELVADRSTQELRQGLLSGLGELVPKVTQSSDSSDCESEQTWRRYRMAPGIEVSFCDDLLSLDSVGVEGLLSQMREIVNINLRNA